MTTEEAHAEAVRRIRAARDAGQDWLDLGDLALESLPAAISGLPRLRVLGLGKLRYNAATPAWEENERSRISLPLKDLSALTRLTALQDLNLSGCYCLADFAPLAKLTALQDLSLGGCAQLTDLRPLASLTALQSLNLGGSNRVGKLAPLAGLTALRSLNLNACIEVADLAPLARLTALDSLDLAMCARVTDLRPLARLTALGSLDLTLCARVTDLKPLASLTTLRILNLSWCPQLTDLRPLRKLTALQELTLSGCSQLADLAPLNGLTNLQSLSLNKCERLTDLSPLASLTTLQSLNLGECRQLTDLGPLNRLTNLHSLDLSRCVQPINLQPLAGLTSLESLEVSFCEVPDWKPLLNLHRLKRLQLAGSSPIPPPPELLDTLPNLEWFNSEGMQGAPIELFSRIFTMSSLPSLRTWWNDLKAGEVKDCEIKLFVLGNGGAGKTQICRRLQGLPFDPTVPTTHGVQLANFEVIPAAKTGSAVRASLWDFGGQDLYHGTHALFLEGRAVFVLVWHPAKEQAGEFEQHGIPQRHQPLTYWLDYVRSLAGPDAPVLVVQSQCDQESQRQEPPLPSKHGFTWLDDLISSAKEETGMESLEVMLKRAARVLLERHGAYRLPASWLKVREVLRERAKSERMMTRAEFEQLCRETHGPSSPKALLSYLHRSGVVFHREGLFQDQVVLDQEWALQAIYAVFDRQRCCNYLRQEDGVFRPYLLGMLVWNEKFTTEEQKLFLSMMESCFICFPLHSWWGKVEKYAVPDLLPEEAAVRRQIESLWPQNQNVQKLALVYDFLHEGILRQFLCSLGRHAGSHALFWRYGCCFYDANTHSRARVRAEMDATPDQPARGRIVIETMGDRAAELLKTLREVITDIRIGPEPKVEGDAANTAGEPERQPSPDGEQKGLEKLQVAPMPPAPNAKPEVYISYAWGGEKEAMVDRLCNKLDAEGYDVKRDKRAMRTGDWISNFILEISRGRRVIAVISEKYLRSPYCMTELLSVYQHSVREKQNFLRRVVPLVLEDVKVDRPRDRIPHVRYWNDELKNLKKETKGLSPAMWPSAAAEMAMLTEFCHCTDLMLQYLADSLMPRGIKDIEKDNFAAVLQALSRKA